MRAAEPRAAVRLIIPQATAGQMCSIPRRPPPPLVSLPCWREPRGVAACRPPARGGLAVCPSSSPHRHQPRRRRCHRHRLRRRHRRRSRLFSARRQSTTAHPAPSLPPPVWRRARRRRTAPPAPCRVRRLAPVPAPAPAPWQAATAAAADGAVTLEGWGGRRLSETDEAPPRQRPTRPWT